MWGPLNCDKNQVFRKFKLGLTHIGIKTQSMTKLQLWQNSNIDKTQVVIKLIMWQNSSCDNSNCDKVPPNSNWKISNCENTHIATKLQLLQNINCDNISILTKQKEWQDPKEYNI